MMAREKVVQSDTTVVARLTLVVVAAAFIGFLFGAFGFTRTNLYTSLNALADHAALSAAPFDGSGEDHRDYPHLREAKVRFFQRPRCVVTRARGAANTTENATTSSLMPLASAMCDGVGPCWGDGHVSIEDLTIPAGALDARSEPLNPKLYCELALLHADTCRDCESFEECASRVGMESLLHSLSSRCTKSAFFQGLLLSHRDQQRSIAHRRGKVEYVFGVVQKSERQWPKPPVSRQRLQWDEGLVPIVSVGARSIVFASSVRCKVHHHWYGYPLSLMLPGRADRTKLFGFAPLLPREFPYWSENYLYQFGMHDEAATYEVHRRSFFGWTHRRGGWSCLRHLELIAAGVVPIFPDIMECARNRYCLPQMPIEMLIEALHLPGVSHLHSLSEASKYMTIRNHNGGGKLFNFHRKGDVRWNEFNHEAYFSLADRLLAYARANLTTTVAATHMLRAMGLSPPAAYLRNLPPQPPPQSDDDATYQAAVLEPVRSVLIFQGDETFDGSTVIHGLAEMGVRVTVANYRGDMARVASNTSTEEMERLRDERLNSKRPYYFTMRYPRGAGHGYSFRADPRFVDQCYFDDPLIEENERKATSGVALRNGVPSCTALLKAGSFQAVFYFIFHRLDYVARLPLLVSVYQSLEPHYERVAFVDTTDSGSGLTHDFCGKGTIFKRELWNEFVPSSN